jgi:SagB-type dehydrogenase family enzyme
MNSEKKLSEKNDLFHLLDIRQSSREYTGEEVSGETLKKIIWAGIGKSRDGAGITAPMPRGIQVIKLYVASKDGVSAYNNEEATLEPIINDDIRDKIANQDFVQEASHVLILTGLHSIYPSKGNDQKRTNMIYTAGGIVMQNVYLAATALGLSTLAVANIKADEIERLLPLENEEQPIFVMPLGK